MQFYGGWFYINYTLSIPQAYSTFTVAKKGHTWDNVKRSSYERKMEMIEHHIGLGTACKSG